MLFISSVFSYTCMISYDEGPSKNFSKVIKEGISLKIPLVFFLDPFSPLFNEDVVNDVLNTGYEVGMSLTEEVNEETIIKILDKYEKEFIKKSGYRPILLRLPAVGKINYEIINKCKGYVVQNPNLDSEDDQKSDIWPFLNNFVCLKNNKDVNISLVFRDRYEKSVDLLKDVVKLFLNNNYKIVSASEQLGIPTYPILIKKKNTTNDNYETKYEILTVSKPYTIRVYTVLNNKEIKEVKINYSTYNKLSIRGLIKKDVKTNAELEDLYMEIIDTCNTVKNEKFKTCHENNGVVMNNILYIAIIIFLM